MQIFKWCSFLRFLAWSVVSRLPLQPLMMFLLWPIQCLCRTPDPDCIRYLNHTHTHTHTHGAQCCMRLLMTTCSWPGHTLHRCHGTFLFFFSPQIDAPPCVDHRCLYVLTQQTTVLHWINSCQLKKTKDKDKEKHVFTELLTADHLSLLPLNTIGPNRKGRWQTEMQNGRTGLVCSFRVTKQWAIELCRASWLPSSSQNPALYIHFPCATYFPFTVIAVMYFNTEWLLWNEWLPGHSLHPVNAKTTIIFQTFSFSDTLFYKGNSSTVLIPVCLVCAVK